MNKKTARNIFILALLAAFILTACGTKELSIDSKWNLVEFASNGNVTNVKEQNFLLRLFVMKDDPKFSSDGAKCRLSIGQKVRNGTVTQEEDGRWRLDFENSKKPLYAEIIGGYLYIHDEEDKIYFKFESR